MNWATKRQLIYGGTVVFIILTIIGLWLFSRFYKPPTCKDQVQNQGELGVDCGGPCAIVCHSEIAKPVVLWSRSFQVAKGVYNAVAYIENPNQILGTMEALYHFRLYDENNILVAQRDGRTFIMPNEKFAILEARIVTGERIPKRTFFEFTTSSDWVKIPNEKPLMIVRGERASNTTTSPRIDAILQNGTLVDIHNIDVVSVAYDKEDNAIAGSATQIETLARDSSLNLVFTWPLPFPSTPARIEVIPRVNMFLPQ